MQRISTNLPNDSMQFYLRERTRAMQQLQNQVATQSRITNLRDAPLAAAHATRYRSYTVRLERFGENIGTIKDRNQIAEGYVQRSVDLLQRARELAVQGAHGTYAPEDLRHMGAEMNEILQEMVELGNARGSDGTMIFSGDRTKQQPFQALTGMVTGDNQRMITEVHYQGTITPQSAEISENVFLESNFPGNRVFWAEAQQIQSRLDARQYQVDQDGTFSVNGVEITLREGDTAFSVIQKINDAGAGVRARLDPVHSSLVIEGTSPRQIWLQDGPGSQVLQDLGLVGSGDDRPPGNIAPSARVSGGSVFDSLIALRDQMMNGDQDALGSRGLRGIDSALDSMFGTLGRIGAVNARLEGSYKRNDMEILDVKGQDSRLTDVDFAEAITDLKMLEMTHRAALGVSARVIQPTLLDFLR
ncbi:flagellar hook-associated protein 3 [Alkalispirochaeta sphaeroplastigenens]|uniref:Flagellar hook-associated protein 3 n=1 Tax=Alkalispirochaeta sphaeroplastigenens TaxID=1187066 RepID=A0A2S4JWT5_9SPIO|nr:flagellar hook-associated protein 3 [Alkalispirochaeta sphaeroplastigenens]POR03974.1 flagellar hook-associated protein 3 [Alkalispirochaeta sphaeroplastigenens]